MRFTFAHQVLGVLLILIGASTPVAAQDRASVRGGKGAPSDPAPAPAPRVLTGKERLGAKWQDEQRVDNCKVPPDKRGTKPRPDACANAPSK